MYFLLSSFSKMIVWFLRHRVYSHAKWKLEEGSCSLTSRPSCLCPGAVKSFLSPPLGCGGGRPALSIPQAVLLASYHFVRYFCPQKVLLLRLISVFRSFLFLLFYTPIPRLCSKTRLYRNGLDVLMLNTQITQIPLGFWTKGFRYCCNCNLL